MRVVFLALAMLSMAMAQANNLGISHSTVIAPSKGAPGCSGARQGAALKGTFYFLPKQGEAPSITTYTPATKQWGTIDISNSPVTHMLNGGSLAAVAAADAATADFLVVSGGGTKTVASYNLKVRSFDYGQRPPPVT